MKELEKLSKQGWRFAVWLIPGGTCIIQGKYREGDGDWDIDEAAVSFDKALKKALVQVSKRLTQANEEDRAAADEVARRGQGRDASRRALRRAAD